MIISDKYQFVFVHIPKCAGTTVRTPLQLVDDSEGFFTSRVDHHSELGLLDYVHIPLFTLRHYFPSDFDKVRTYWSFAVMRDPFARFPSSISQRFRMYGDQPIQKQGAAEIKAEIECTIDFLSTQPRENHCLPAEYIHFQKQIDYIRLDGMQMIDTIYSVDEISQLLFGVSQRAGYKIHNNMPGDGPCRANRTLVHRNEFIRLLIESTRPVTRQVVKLLPRVGKEKLRSTVYVSRDRRLESLFASDYVQDFIKDYYHDDVDLWNGIK